MRIISGRARGVRLKTPDEELPVRPTGDRVKEAMFSAIQFDIKGNVLDLFAGTGQLGLEALSRGAEFCVFCDKEPSSCAIVRENIKRTKSEDRSKLLNIDYKRYLKHDADRKFNVVFIDPPYASGLSDKALTYLSDGELLEKDAVVVLECDSADRKPEEIGKLILRKRYTFSGVSFLVYIVRDEDE